MTLLNQLYTFWPLVLIALYALYCGLIVMGNKAAESDQLKPAIFAYSLLNLLWPFSARNWTKYGNLWGDLGGWPQARICFQIALKLQPQWIEAWLGIGIVYLVLDQNTQAAHQAFLKAYCLRRGTPVNLENMPKFEPQAELEPPQTHKLIHDVQQLNYLVKNALLPASFLQVAEQFQQAAQQLSTPSELAHPEYYQQALYLAQPSYAQPLHRIDPKPVEHAYFDSGKILAWYDDFLKVEALRALRQFCLQSTFWHHVYENGYLGAYLDDGMTCSLLYEIAADLKHMFPAIFEDTHLLYLWAFKCRSQTAGVALHHDSAMVNVNFWLTPDPANRNPESGGICVYPKEPPQTWDLERYQIDTQTMNDFVKGVPPIYVPYRQNRVVIFNSRLFHASQAFDFEPGFENERINVTLLFGKQPLRYHPKLKLKID